MLALCSALIELGLSLRELAWSATHLSLASAPLARARTLWGIGGLPAAPPSAPQRNNCRLYAANETLESQHEGALNVPLSLSLSRSLALWAALEGTLKSVYIELSKFRKSPQSRAGCG